jgi:hypothetical protein
MRWAMPWINVCGIKQVKMICRQSGLAARGEENQHAKKSFMGTFSAQYHL